MQTSNAEHHWLKGVASLAARNGPIDLTPASDERRDHYRSRLLAVGADGQMLVERPTAPGVAAALAAGTAVDVTVLVDGRRWQGTTLVLGLERVALNRDTAVPALRLAPATNLRSGQRRQFYRVDLVAHDLCEFAFLPEGTPDQERLLELHLVNLSAGGLGLRALATAPFRETFRHGALFRCRLGLRPGARHLELRSRLVHVERLPERLTHLGLQFEHEDAAAESRVQDELTRFVTELERKQLRRARGA